MDLLPFTQFNRLPHSHDALLTDRSLILQPCKDEAFGRKKWGGAKSACYADEKCITEEAVGFYWWTYTTNGANAPWFEKDVR
jgi:hypothetical protein